MSALGKKLRSLEGGRVAFMCPGCKEMHQIPVAKSEHANWAYNQNPDLPTFTPSILVRGVKTNLTDAEWAEYDKQDVAADREKILAGRRFNSVCHSFVTDGVIKFLSDCTHDLVGQSVELPDLGESE